MVREVVKISRKSRQCQVSIDSDNLAVAVGPRRLRDILSTSCFCLLMRFKEMLISFPSKALSAFTRKITSNWFADIALLPPIQLKAR